MADYIVKDISLAPWGRKEIEIAETELMGLHAGNIARYRIRPAQFEAWLSTWA